MLLAIAFSIIRKIVSSRVSPQSMRCRTSGVFKTDRPPPFVIHGDEGFRSHVRERGSKERVFSVAEVACSS